MGGNFPQLFNEAQQLGNISPGDMPNPKTFCQSLDKFPDLSNLPLWNEKDLTKLNHVIEVEVPRLLEVVGGVTIPNMSLSEIEVHGASPGSRFLECIGFGDRGGKRKREGGA